MHNDEVTAQIAKFKARRLKTRLAYYSTFTSLFLTLSLLSDGLNFNSLISLLLILPLPIYFTLQSIKLTQKNRQLKSRMESLNDLISCLTQSKFSFSKFITQPNFSFRLTIALFCLVIFTTLARIRTPDPTLSMIPHQSLTLPSQVGIDH